MQPGRFELQVEWQGQEHLIIESSSDLENWEYEALWFPSAVYPDTSPALTQKFYRARDYVVRVAGMVRDIVTETPLAEAIVILSSEGSINSTTNTDAEGSFRLTLLPSGLLPTGRFDVMVEKPGFEPLTISRSHHPRSLDFSVTIDLLPVNYPPNDDFHNRTTLEGTDITIDVSTIGAWMEPRHFLEIPFDDYSDTYPRDVWYSWTAPSDGAVLIQPRG